MTDGDHHRSLSRRELLALVGGGTAITAPAVAAYERATENTTEPMTETPARASDYPLQISENYMIGPEGDRPPASQAEGVVWEVLDPTSPSTVRRTLSDGETWFTLDIETNAARTDQTNNTVFIGPEQEFIREFSRADPGDTVVVLPGQHYPDSSFTVPANVHLHVSAGATVYAPPLKARERFIRIRNQNCALTGQGTIDGNPDAGQPRDSEGQEHIIDVRSTESGSPIDGFVLDGLTLRDAPGGDCLYVNGVRNMIARGFTARRGYRNGVSIISGESIILENFITEEAAGTPPMSGVVIEPNGPENSLRNVTIDGFESASNKRHGLVINTDKTSSDQEVIVNIESGLLTNNEWDGIDVSRATNSTQISVRSCFSIANGGAGFNIGGASNLTLYEPIAMNNGQSPNKFSAPVGFFLDQYNGKSATNVQITNAIATDDQPGRTQQRPAIIESGAQASVFNLVIGPHKTSNKIALRGGELQYQHVTRRDGGDPIQQAGGTLSPQAQLIRIFVQQQQPTPRQNELCVWRQPGDGSESPTHRLLYNYNGTVITFGGR